MNKNKQLKEVKIDRDFILRQDFQDDVAYFHYGDLDLSYTNIRFLPKYLICWFSSLDLSYSSIEALPEALYVGQDLNASHTNIEYYPYGCVVAGNIRLDYTKIKSLPDNLKVNKMLIIEHTEMESLPENLTVCQTLYLSHTKIKSLPNSLILGYPDTKDFYNPKIYLKDTLIPKITHDFYNITAYALKYRNEIYFSIDGLSFDRYEDIIVGYDYLISDNYRREFVLLIDEMRLEARETLF